MLAELLLRVLTPAALPARRMGLVNDSIGLWSRSTRRRREWRPHYERCKGVVTDVVEALPRRRTVAVLGSGLVQDVPIDALCAAFERVILVDAVHLPMVRWRMRARPRVTLVTRDLTGLAGLVEGKAAGRTPPVADLAGDPQLDLVISANVLSQLPLGVDSLLDKSPSLAARLPPHAADSAVVRHLDDLARFACHVCLLTDVTMRGEDRAGRTVETLDLMRGHAMPAPADAWDWTVAPFGEIDRDVRYVHRVHAYPDWRASSRHEAVDRARDSTA